MRNLEECQAEVFRRSEKRIKARKVRRTRILAVCVPLVLCVAGLALLPRIGGNGLTHVPATEIAGYLYSDTMAQECVAVLYADTIAVSGNGISHVYSDAEKVSEIVTLLHMGTQVSEIEEEDGMLTVTTRDDAVDLGTESKAEGYRITIRRSVGAEIQYELHGTRLVNETTGEIFCLDEETCFALKEALGIVLY